MSREITMPQLGFTMVEGTVTDWRKREGDSVAQGEILMEVTTEKVSVEVEASVAGVLERILVPAGATVPVGTPVCLIAEKEEERRLMASAETEEPPIRASGVAKRLARERGIDLAVLTGTGPRGRIVEADVLRFLEEQAISYQPSALSPGPGEPPASTDEAVGASPRSRPSSTLDRDRQQRDAGKQRRAAPTVFGAQSSVPGQRIPFAGARRIIADRMIQSARETAHVTLVAEVDATEAVRLREQLLPEWEKSHGVRLSFTDLIVKACAKALRDHPAVNATLQGEEIILLEEVNVGIAVALPEGLLVPVLHRADAKELWAIALEVRDLVERARGGKLSVDEVTRGTFTVTNLGSYGIDLFTPIVNPPETAILGVGRIAERPAVYNGEICKRALMYLSLTFDHRLVDGAPAALFLQRVRELLEHPYRLLA